MPGKVFQTECVGNTLIVAPHGNTFQFRYVEVHVESNAVLHMLDAPELEHLVVDFTNIQASMDSLSIGAIIRLIQAVRNRGGRAVAYCVSEETREFLQTMNFEALCPAHATREEALAAIASTEA